MILPTQQSLLDFYESVKFHDPELAELMLPHIQIVALWALGSDTSGGQDSADRLRQGTRLFLPEVFNKIINHTLDEMGYS